MFSLPTVGVSTENSTLSARFRKPAGHFAVVERLCDNVVTPAEVSVLSPFCVERVTKISKRKRKIRKNVCALRGVLIDRDTVRLALRKARMLDDTDLYLYLYRSYKYCSLRVERL